MPTLSRLLASTDEVTIQVLRQRNLQMVLDRLAQQGMLTLTRDFDGSVLSTSRHAPGTAVGFNKQKKGARSYYPLFCHWAQTGQVLDVDHREPLQLGLFRPVERGVDFKVILTNNTMDPGKVVSLHECRGSQGKVFGELKSRIQLGHVPCRRLHAYQTWLPGAITAHNLGRELQMEQAPPPRELGDKRTARRTWDAASHGVAPSGPSNLPSGQVDADAARHSGPSRGFRRLRACCAMKY